MFAFTILGRVWRPLSICNLRSTSCPADTPDIGWLNVQILSTRRSAVRGAVVDGWRGGEWLVRVGISERLRAILWP